MDFHPKCTLGVFSLAFLVIISRSLVCGAEEIKANAPFQNYRVLHYGEPLFLQCNVSNPSPDLVMKWYKNGKLLQSSEGKRPKVTISQKDNVNTLKISNAMQEDVANYTCQLVNSKSNQTSSMDKFDFEVVGKPVVKLPETITVIEEEKLKLECIVLGSHNPIVEWKVGNKTYDESEGRVKLSTDPVRNVKNNVMELEHAQMSDRGEVACSATNIATTMEEEPNKATIYVRVKDKYAALWPFLGICAEVIVLCSVIFIYEKKRNKTELEESDTDQSPEQKNTPDGGKESVRQRK